MNISNSNNPTWIEKIVSIKNPSEIEILQLNFGMFSKKIKTYTNSEIRNIKFQDAGISNFTDKSTTGTIIGGALGGAIAGSTGAVVGALATGNNKNEIIYKNIIIEFFDEQWIQLDFKISESNMQGRLDKVAYSECLKRFATLQSNPFK